MSRSDFHGDDGSVIEAVLAGDTERFGTLVERYQERLFNGIARVLGNAADAEEVVQETLVQAYFKLTSFRFTSSFYTWIFRIALNTAINHRRRYRRTVSLGDQTETESTAADDPPERRLENAEEASEVQRGLERLTEEHRQILVLREIEGMSYETIAEILGLPIGTVRSRLHRARLQFR